VVFGDHHSTAHAENEGRKMATTTEQDARNGTVDQHVRERIEVALGSHRSDPPIGDPSIRRPDPLIGNRRADDPPVNGRSRPVSIVIADHRRSSRIGTARALAHHGFEVLSEAGAAGELLTLVFQHRPDVCLLEIDLPGDPIAAIAEIHSELPRTQIAVLTGSRADGDVTRALRAGANGYLLKTMAPDRLSVAISALFREEIVLPRALTGALVAELRKSDGSDTSRVAHARASLLYMPRFARHFLRRRRARMPAPEAWSSARTRMRRYD
jgi:DNA-binding NarL/FixJ family response regulator